MIEYAGTCFQGLVRSNNEDNLYIDGKYLPVIHKDSPMFGGWTACHGKPKAFAVFDGMGGEEKGEMASFLAAEGFGRGYALHTGGKGEEQYQRLGEICLQMNKDICQYGKKHSLSFCGSTAALITVCDQEIVAMNLGDSRIYLLRKGRLIRLSQDHVMISPLSGRRSLTQCLGIPESEFIINPYTVTRDYQKGDIYLICSDGVTDLMSEEDMESFLAEEESCSAILLKMKDDILKRGAIDNTTIIMVRLH